MTSFWNRIGRTVAWFEEMECLKITTFQMMENVVLSIAKPDSGVAKTILTKNRDGAPLISRGEIIDLANLDWMRALQETGYQDSGTFNFRSSDNRNAI